MSQSPSKVTSFRASTAAAKASTASIKSPPQGAPESAADKAAISAATGTGVITLKKGALSTDVGPRVIAAMFGDESQIEDLRDQITELKASQATKQYQQLSDLTQAICKAAKADTSIDLSVAFNGEKKQMERLNNQIGLALGFREVVQTTGKDGLVYDSIQTAKAVSAYLPLPGESAATTPNYDRKNTFRGNFMTQLKKCAQAALALNLEGIKSEFDKKAGTLLISGPAVQKHFGQARVLLNEKQSVGDGDAKVNLTEKPSFQALANIAGKALGAKAARGAGGAQHRGAQSGTIPGTLAQASEAATKLTGKETMDAGLLSVCKSLMTLLDKVETLSKDAVAALENVENAIEIALANKAPANGNGKGKGK